MSRRKYKIDILVGERPGGSFDAILSLEEEGEKFLFRTQEVAYDITGKPLPSDNFKLIF